MHMFNVKTNCVRAMAVILTCSISFSMLAGCSKKEEPAEVDNSIAVYVSSPGRGSIQVDGEFIGTVDTADEINVVSKLTGDVTETYFEEGDHVEAGDLMFTIDDKSQKITLQSAQAGVQTADATYANAQISKDIRVYNEELIRATITETMGKTQTTQMELDFAVNAAIRGYQNAVRSAEYAKDNYGYVEDNYDYDRNHHTDQERLALFSAAVAVETAKNGVLDAKDQEKLKQKYLADYNEYTKNKILADVNNTIVNAYKTAVNTDSTLSQADAGKKQAAASLASAKLQLDYTQVKAPVSGTITKKSIIKNNVISAMTVAYVIVPDEKDKTISFYVSEKIMNNLTKGQYVSVVRNDKEYLAKVAENLGIVDASSGLFKVKAALETGKDELVANTKVKLRTGTDKVQDVMTLPIDCIYYEADRGYVYVADGALAKKVFVETGLADSEKVEITSGLSETDKVITSWSDSLRDGSEIKIK